ncbi:MAG: AraC family transcriptional regulator [Oscillospiraceae bacterium]|nr:AraC family transcriptional regulator [Oscillospiraceae bacterium]
MDKYFRESKERLIVTNTYSLDFPPHIHDEVELVYMLQGSCSAYCADQHYELKAGDCFLVFPEQVHHYQNSRDCHAYLMIVHPKQLDLVQQTPVHAVYPCEDEDLKLLLDLTVREYETQKDKEVAIPLLRAVLGKLLRHYTLTDDPVQDNAVQQIVRYCSSHYKEPLTVSAVAKALYRSQSYISHTFSERLKISFSDYVNSLRLDEAIRLLKLDGLSIEQVAELSGFPTTRTFHRAFRNKYGISPRGYKKSGL